MGYLAVFGGFSGHAGTCPGHAGTCPGHAGTSGSLKHRCTAGWAMPEVARDMPEVARDMPEVARGCQSSPRHQVI